MTRRSVWLLFLPFVAALAQASGQSALLSYFAGPAGAQQCCAATDKAGDIVLVCATNQTSVSITKLDSSLGRRMA